MATPDAVQEIRAALATITKHDRAMLVRRAAWGEITFDSADADIEIVLSVAADLSNLPIEYLPEISASAIARQIPQVADLLDEIDNFTIAQGSAADNRDNITARLKIATEAFHKEAIMWIPYLAYRRGDVSENLERIRAAVGTAESEVETIRNSLGAQREEALRIVNSIRESAADAGVAVFTKDFENEAIVVAGQSKAWLWAAVIGVALTIGFAGLYGTFWPTLSENAGAWDIMRLMVTKVSIIVLLATGTIWCGRMYRALIHQKATNRHRALSLKTFQAFVEATDDDRTKDAVLMATTNSIFANLQTGFVDPKTLASDPPVQFVEIGKSVAKKAVPPGRLDESGGN